MLKSVIREIERCAIVPVIALEREDDASPLADALVAGGLPIAEITFRTAAAEASIKTMAKRGDLLVGAGTVLNIDTVKRAVDAGASFIVSPGFNPKVVAYCVERDIAITPGCVTPTEIESAIEYGLNAVKFFPAESFGGLQTIKALAGPYGAMRFIPTGGVTESLLRDYLNCRSVLAVGGSWFVSRELIAAGDFSEITRLTRAAVDLARGAGR